MSHDQLAQPAAREEPPAPAGPPEEFDADWARVLDCGALAPAGPAGQRPPAALFYPPARPAASRLGAENARAS